MKEESVNNEESQGMRERSQKGQPLKKAAKESRRKKRVLQLFKERVLLRYNAAISKASLHSFQNGQPFGESGIRPDFIWPLIPFSSLFTLIIFSASSWTSLSPSLPSSGREHSFVKLFCGDWKEYDCSFFGRGPHSVENAIQKSVSPQLSLWYKNSSSLAFWSRLRGQVKWWGLDDWASVSTETERQV